MARSSASTPPRPARPRASASPSPSIIAKPIIEQVKAGKDIARPWIGIDYQDLDAQVAKDKNLDVTDGAWIHVSAEGQAAGQGQGRRSPTPSSRTAPQLTRASRPRTSSPPSTARPSTAEHPLDLVLLTHAPGDTVTLTVLRDGASQSIELTLGTRPADAQ